MLLSNSKERSGADELSLRTLLCMVTYEALFAFVMLLIAFATFVKNERK